MVSSFQALAVGCILSLHVAALPLVAPPKAQINGRSWSVPELPLLDDIPLVKTEAWHEDDEYPRTYDLAKKYIKMQDLVMDLDTSPQYITEVYQNGYNNYNEVGDEFECDSDLPKADSYITPHKSMVPLDFYEENLIKNKDNVNLVDTRRPINYQQKPRTQKKPPTYKEPAKSLAKEIEDSEVLAKVTVVDEEKKSGTVAPFFADTCLVDLKTNFYRRSS